MQTLVIATSAFPNRHRDVSVVLFVSKIFHARLARKGSLYSNFKPSHAGHLSARIDYEISVSIFLKARHRPGASVSQSGLKTRSDWASADRASRLWGNLAEKT